MTSDQTLDLAIQMVELTWNAKQRGEYDRKAILRDLSTCNLNAAAEFLRSFKTAPLTGRPAV